MGQECQYRTREGSQVQAIRALSPSSLPRPWKHPTPPPALSPLGRQELHHLPGASCRLTCTLLPPVEKAPVPSFFTGHLTGPS